MGKKTIVNLLALAGIAVSGCATAPSVYEFSNTTTVRENKDAVWERVVQYFAMNNLSIKTIEKDSGIIAAERMFANPTREGLTQWASCGSAPLEIPVSQSADLNVFVRSVPGGTNVTVNARFQETRRFGNSPLTVTACNSTGQLEKTLLAVAEGR